MSHSVALCKIGFNRGNGTRWRGFDRYSGKEDIINIDTSSNSDIRGEFHYFPKMAN